MGDIPDPKHVEKMARALFGHCVSIQQEQRLHAGGPPFLPADAWDATTELNRAHWRSIAETALCISLEDVQS